MSVLNVSNTFIYISYALDTVSFIMLPWFWIVRSVLLVFSSYWEWDRRCRDCMVVGFTCTCAFSAYKINLTNINNWHSVGTSRYYPPCSSWVEHWTHISLPIPVDLIWFDFWCFTFSNTSTVSWRSELVVEEAGLIGENHRHWASNW